MADKLASQQAKFHRSKAIEIKREWENRKTCGERRVQKLEEELKLELSRLQDQIDSHNNKAKILEEVATSKVVDKYQP